MQAPRRNNREHRLQSFADRFIDRVVLPPMFTSAIDAAGQMTDNARARAAGRGVVFGLPDALVAQGDGTRLTALAFIEYKRGTKLTARQESVHATLKAAGIPVFTASTIADLLDALYLARFRLHGNAANIATEIEAKLDAADDTAAIKLSRPRPSTKMRAKRATAAQIKRAHAAGVWG